MLDVLYRNLLVGHVKPLLQLDLKLKNGFAFVSSSTSSIEYSSGVLESLNFAVTLQKCKSIYGFVASFQVHRARFFIGSFDLIESAECAKKTPPSSVIPYENIRELTPCLCCCKQAKIS